MDLMSQDNWRHNKKAIIYLLVISKSLILVSGSPEEAQPFSALSLLVNV